MITIDLPPMVAVIEEQQQEQTIQDIIYTFCLDELGLNKAAACGIMANIQAESEYNPNAGSKYGAYGLCQWCGGRRQALINKVGHEDAWTQLVHMAEELENGYTHVLNKLREVENNEDGARQAAYYFCKHFEIPSNVEWKSNYRAGIAADIWNMIIELEAIDAELSGSVAELNRYFAELVLKG